jgi:putative selenium metabolism protein SsnA
VTRAGADGSTGGNVLDGEAVQHVLTGGTVVTSLDPPSVERADLLVRDGRVSAVGRFERSDDEVDCGGSLIVPGNVCAHHHLYSALARGMPYGLAPPENFVEILRRVWWRLDRALDDDSNRASALLGGADALLAGTTTIVDHHASPNAIDGSLDIMADALESLGVRSVLAYEVTDRDGPQRAAAGIEENRRFLKIERDLTRGLVGAHASFTLSDDTLDACIEVARDGESGIHIHVAEDGADQDDSMARFGRSVMHRLAAAGAVNERSVLAHCIHLDEEEIEIVRDSSATAVHNPRSNMNNAVGRARVGSFPRLALGTDGIGGDMFGEARAGFWRAREAGDATGPEWALERLAESARLAGRMFWEPLLGRLEPTAPADLVVLDYEPPTPLSSENLAAHWVYGLSTRMVRDVMVAGEWVVRDGGLTRVDQDALAARSAEQADRLWERLATIDEHPFQPAG